MRLDIWDTSGQEKYRSLTPMYFRDADAAILFFDLSNSKSFDDLKFYWMRQVEEYGPGNIQVVIVGNKLDLVDTGPDLQRQLSDVA